MKKYAFAISFKDGTCGFSDGYNSAEEAELDLNDILSTCNNDAIDSTEIFDYAE